MRILTILTQKPFSTGSGMYLTGVINALREMGHEQALVAGIMADESIPEQNASFRSEEGRADIALYPVYYGTEEVPFPVVGMSDQMPYTSTRYKDLTAEQEEALKAAFHKVISKAVAEFQPDLILCHHLYLLTSWVRDWFPEHRIYGICHGSDLRQFRQNETWREQVRNAVQKLDRVYALHAVQKKQIEELMGCGDVRILGSAIDQSVFCMDPSEEPADTIGNADKKTILYVGKRSRSKGVPSLLRAVTKLAENCPNLRLVLVGGPGNEAEMQKIQAQIDTCPCEVVLPGLLPPKEVAKWYRKADCFVLPSFYEGLPLVIFEARACGAPVVCTNLPGVKEWADGNVPGHAIAYVPAPSMVAVDEPLKEALPAYEEALSRAIWEKLSGGREAEPIPDLRELTWQAVAERILHE